MLKGGMHGWKDAGGAMVEAPKPTAAQQGLVLYAAHCATCHQSQGAGLAGHFPPLAGDAVVNSQDHTALTSIILKGGRGGKINGKTYPGEMPAFAGPLLDSEVATLETYIRSHWGNKAPPVVADDVRRVRSALGGKK